MAVLIWTSDGKKQNAEYKTCAFTLKGLKRGHKLSGRGTFPNDGGFKIDFWGNEQACKDKAEEVVKVYEQVTEADPNE